MSKDEALKMAIEALEDIHFGNMTPMAERNWNKALQACKEALEQEERTQRTMYCGTTDAFIAMDDDQKRRWFVQSLRESKRRKELEDILEQPAQEPEYVYVNPITKDMYYLTKAEQPAQPIELKPANIAKARDEIYYAWRKYWAWGIPSKDGEAVFNANGDGFLAGWLACEEWINKEKNHGL
jgi:hypothetical protein